MTNAELYQILIEAEARAATHPDPEVRERSAETVVLVYRCMEKEGITRATLASAA